METTSQEHHDATGTPHTEAHASEGTYFAIFLLLAALTMTELICTYLPIVKVPLLLGLAATKAWIVIQFYMHLRYDNKLFSWIILAPTITGVIITIALQILVSMGYH